MNKMNSDGHFQPPSDDEIHRVFCTVDKTKSGVLSLSEVEEAVSIIWPGSKSLLLPRAFKIADLNSDGQIGQNELGLLFQCLHQYRRLESLGLVLNDNFVAKEEGIRVLSELSYSDVHGASKDLEKDQTGTIIIDDLCLWMAMRSMQLLVDSSYGACFRIANSASARLLSKALSEDPCNALINQVVVALRKSLDVLGVRNVPDEVIESWSLLINSCMSTSARDYHNIQRIFKITVGSDPIQLIAALFHDCVRYTSFGLSREVSGILRSAIEIKEDKINCLEVASCAPHIKMVYSLFGFEPGQMLHFRKGMDRFLSSLLAVCLLEGTVPLEHLAKVVLCIRAATNYSILKAQYSALRRSKVSLPEWCMQEIKGEIDESGRRTLGNLHDVLVEINVTHKLGLSQRRVVKAVQRAADMSNRCYGMFGSDDVPGLMARLWSWLPEVNHSLQEMKLFTISDYLVGLKILQPFLAAVEVEKMYAASHNVPTAAEYQCLTRKFSRNRQLCLICVSAKAVCLGILAAFSELTGGNVPMAFFLGDHPTDRQRSDQLGDGLPQLSDEEIAPCNVQIYDILANARGSTDAFDVNMSPVTAFVYGKLGDEGIANVIKYTDHPFDKNLAFEFLSALPLDVVVPLGKEIAKIAVTRTDLIEEVLLSIVNGRTVEEIYS